MPQPTPMEVYKFCPKCAGLFEYKGENWLKCTMCGYDFFVNAAVTPGALICNDKNEVLLVKRKFEPNKDAWQIPGGFAKPNETYEDALCREIEEELGVQIELGVFVASHPMNYLYGGVLLPILCMYTTADIISGRIIARDDATEIRFFSLEEVLHLTLNAPEQSIIIKAFLEKRQKNLHL
jgi:NAD+ diphosphatase